MSRKSRKKYKRKLNKEHIMVTMYGIRFQAIQDHYHQDNNKLRYINELRNLSLDIHRKNPTGQLEELLRVVELREEYLSIRKEVPVQC